MAKPLKDSKIKKINKENARQISEDLTLVFVLQDVDDAINIGSFFRIADACNASMILTGKTPTPPNNAISMTSRGFERRVDWEYVENFEDAFHYLKKLGFQVIGVEITENSIPYSKYHFTPKTALVLGNEAIGIYKKNLELLDGIVHIPMLGKGPSLNVNVAGAIVAYEVVSQFSD